MNLHEVFRESLERKAVVTLSVKDWGRLYGAAKVLQEEVTDEEGQELGTVAEDMLCQVMTHAGRLSKLESVE